MYLCIPQNLSLAHAIYEKTRRLALLALVDTPDFSPQNEKSIIGWMQENWKERGEARDSESAG